MNLYRNNLVRDLFKGAKVEQYSDLAEKIYISSGYSSEVFQSLSLLTTQLDRHATLRTSNVKRETFVAFNTAYLVAEHNLTTVSIVAALLSPMYNKEDHKFAKAVRKTFDHLTLDLLDETQIERMAYDFDSMEISEFQGLRPMAAVLVCGKIAVLSGMLLQDWESDTAKPSNDSYIDLIHHYIDSGVVLKNGLVKTSLIECMNVRSTLFALNNFGA